MRCCTRRSPLLQSALRATLALLALLVMFPVLAPLSVRAAEIEPLDARVVMEDGDVLLSAEFAIDLGERLEDALTRGVMLAFKLECVIERPRDYWLSEHVAAYAQTYRLSYSSLTRQYRLSIGGLHQSFASLADALRAMGKVNGLPVTETEKLRPAMRYEASLRLALDSSQLPKPFQLDALTSNAWKVEAKTRRWSFSTP